MDQDFHQSLHIALVNAADEPRADNSFVVSSFKIKPDDLDAVQAICENNGATVSGFIRQVFKQLISDYIP